MEILFSTASDRLVEFNDFIFHEILSLNFSRDMAREKGQSSMRYIAEFEGGILATFHFLTTPQTTA